MRMKLSMARSRAAAARGMTAYETALCEAIVQAVLRLAGGREVTKVVARIGGHPVDPDLIHQCMQKAVAGTVAEHAVIEFDIDPPAVRCRDCGNEMAAGYALALLSCRQCGSFNIEVLGTDNLLLESVAFAE